MVLHGAEKLQHLDYLKTDPLFCRVIRLTRIPHRTKISMALKQFTSNSLKAIKELNSKIVIEKIESIGLNGITIDLDGTVINTKANPSRASKGYNPIKKGSKSYFLLTAHIADTGHFVSIIYRPGNIHDSYRALHLIKMIQKQIRQFSIRFRADSAFCVPQVINYLLHNNISFAIKAPFLKLLSLKEAAQQRRSWFKIDYTWSYFRVKNPMDSLD
ncbi:MAG: transposase [Deltaproteobacteria bacterium]|nr:transposase [Deltaproteobacteria bacterium]